MEVKFKSMAIAIFIEAHLRDNELFSTQQGVALSTNGLPTFGCCFNDLTNRWVSECKN